MHTILRAWLVLRRLIEAAIIFVFLVMVAGAMGQVLARYVFNIPLRWSEELSRYLFIWLSFLGAWLAWVRREHLGIDLFTQSLPEPLRRLIVRLIEALVVLFAASAMYFGQHILAVSARQPSAVLRLPMVWVYLAFYTGMTLVILETLMGWIRDAAGLQEDRR